MDKSTAQRGFMERIGRGTLMDRDIIAPGPDLHWHVSKVLDPRRSNGERELHELSGKSLLRPKD